MSIPRRMVCGVMVVLLAVGPLQSALEADLHATIAKAIKARGGEGNEGQYKGMTMKGAGNFYGLGEAIPYSGEWYFQGHTQSRATLEIKVMNQVLTFTQVVNGDKGWVKFNDEVKEMSEDELAEEKHSLYAKWVSSLVPLKDKAFKLASIGEVKIDDKAAVGVRVSHAGKRDVNLFFDKAGGLLVKVEHQVKDVKGGGDKETPEETFFADYKQFKGTRYPTKIIIKRDAKLYVEADMTEIRPLERVEDPMFAKP